MEMLSILGNAASIASAIISIKKMSVDKSSLNIKRRSEIYQSRPEMDIVEYKDYISRTKYGTKKSCDIDLFVAHIEAVDNRGTSKKPFIDAYYNNAHFNKSEWCCVLYTLKNVGKTDIRFLDIICRMKRDTCIFHSVDAKWYLENKILNYSECFDKRKIRVGDTVTLKVCYHRDAVIIGNIAALLYIGMVDDNGRNWVQPLFTPVDKLYSSRQVSPKEYHDLINTEIAEKCFANPMLW